MKKNKGGRPFKTIDLEQLNKLIGLQCTGEEVASYFNIDYDTLNRIVQDEYSMSYSDYYKQKKGMGKVSLRRAQYQSAMDGNITMQIWLGKNWLGQSDKQEITHAGNQTIRVEITDDD
jgi:hypothetical protein